jgi:ATP-dependent RNA helicase DDX21
MTTTILRRSSSIFSRRFFAAITSVELLPIRHRSLPLSSAVYGKGDRLFHAKSGPLNFHSSLVSRGSQLAVDYDDAQHDEGFSSGNGDEGLEIAKLGISKEIVNALAKKGIAKLFPIQVCSLFHSVFQISEKFIFIIIIIIIYCFNLICIILWVPYTF